MTTENTSIYCADKPASWDPYRQPKLRVKFFFKDSPSKEINGMSLDPFYAVETIRKLMQMDPTIEVVHLLEETGPAIWSVTQDGIKTFGVETEIKIFVGAGNWI